MELLRSFGAEPLIIHSTDTLKNHPLLFPRGETKLRSELERALEIAVHHYINNKDCLGHHKICDNHHRDHLHITVKLYLSHSAGPQCAEQAVQAILHQLETDYIDLLIVSVACLDNLLASWRSLEQLYLESKIKQIGVSEFSVKELHILLQYANVKPALNEAKICCMHDEKEKEDLVKFASINGITIRSQPCHDNDSVR
jgi:diketogulonate reductase-like aldo/keto reductase